MTRQPVAVELPQMAREYGLAYDLAVIAGGSLFLAACARVSFPVPFSPVPVTGQTFGVLLLGMLLGGWRAASAVTLYLLEGIAGLPVFAAGAGPGYLLGPTGGYLLSFVPAAWVTGQLAQRGWDRTHGRTLAAMGLGTAIIFVGGCTWLTILTGSVTTALATGFTPFLSGAVVKIALATALLPLGWRIGRALHFSERTS
ncbi:MAG: biotin transporter BioY [Planctomycetota bacterium]